MKNPDKKVELSEVFLNAFFFPACLFSVIFFGLAHGYNHDSGFLDAFKLTIEVCVGMFIILFIICYRDEQKRVAYINEYERKKGWR